MGRASSSKKVARAARAAGRPGTGRNWLWPAAITVLVGLGVTLVVISRDSGEAAATPPMIGDHWHAAYAISTCGEVAAPLAGEGMTDIHTHEDGLAHIEPQSTEATGDKATLAVFTEPAGLTIEDDRLEPPDGDAFVEGEDDCDGEPAQVQLAVWDDIADEEPEIVTEDIGDHRFRDGELLTIAFAPEGAELEKPASAAELASQGAGAGQQPVPSLPDPSTEPTGPPGETPTSAPADGSTTTTPAPDGSTTTSAP